MQPSFIATISVFIFHSLCHPAAPAAAQRHVDTTAIEAMLRTKLIQLDSIKEVLEAQWTDFFNVSSAHALDGPGNKTCFGPGGRVPGRSLDGCGFELPSMLSPTCSAFFGDTEGCGCNGRSVVPKVMVKALHTSLDSEGQRKAATVACFATGGSMERAYQAVSGAIDNSNKLMYFGSVDGVIAYYPGMLWQRTIDSHGEKTCGASYDPRKRPWYLAASNGPKNVIFVLDSSGSMGSPSHYPRWRLLKTAAKAIIDGLTISDFVSTVDFDDGVRTFEGNQFMGRATSEYRDKMKTFIDTLDAAGGTYYSQGFSKAFEIADNNMQYQLESGCQTIFVFLTDWMAADDPTSLIQRRQASKSRKEMFFIIGLGNAVSGSQTLKKLACDIDGIFESVNDPIDGSTPSVRIAEAKLLDSLASFSRYLQVSSSISKRENASFSEIYEGTNFPMRMTTAAVPIYDKRESNRWKLLGVVGVDFATCELEKKVACKNPAIEETAGYSQETVIEGCKCADSFTYKGKTYNGCTTKDWGLKWCGSVGCGIPLSSVSTGYFADCRPAGVTETIEALLMKSGEACSLDPISAHALEALRPAPFRCGATSAEVIKEIQSNFFSGIPGVDLPTTVNVIDWSQNSDGVFDETLWSTDTDECDLCSTHTQPTCAKPAGCETGSDTIDCPCDIGFSGPDGGPCLPCKTGSFKTVDGSANCTLCIKGKFSSVVGANSSSVCVNCSVNTYSMANGSACAACPSNSVSGEGSANVTECKCMAGFTGPDGGACEACAAGRYKEGRGDGGCVTCPTGSDSPPGSNSARKCKCIGPNGGPCVLNSQSILPRTSGARFDSTRSASNTSDMDFLVLFVVSCLVFTLLVGLGCWIRVRQFHQDEINVVDEKQRQTNQHFTCPSFA